MRETDVAVIGAGPAGLSAALAAADAGASVVVLDEYRRPGGQYYRRPAEPLAAPQGALTRSEPEVTRLEESIRSRAVVLLTEALVWGIYDDGRQVMVYRDGVCESVRAAAVVLATGAYDRPVAFPGWTLPGVMSAGALQALVKGQLVLPGRRILLVGSGPFLLPVAEQLAAAGAELVGLAEATGPADWARGGAITGAWGQWDRIAELARYARGLRRARVPVFLRHRLAHVAGESAVERATLVRVDAEWQALPRSERELEVDAVGVGYGFLPATELAEACGCELRWDEYSAAWFVACDDRMQTSVTGIFAAGEIVGIGGAALATAEGRLAGIGAAEHCGTLSSEEALAARTSAARSVQRLGRFAGRLNRVFRPRPGLWEPLDDGTIVCRCEEVTAGEVRERIANGCATPKQLKDWTRAGMGLCQGRMCRATVSKLVSVGTGQPIETVPPGRVRPPVKPVPIGPLTEMDAP